MDVGARLKAVRGRFALSQRELAKRAGVTNATVSLIEQNRVSPSISSLKKLLEGFPISLAEFFTFEQEIAVPSYIFPAGVQPNLGNATVQMYLVGSGVVNRQIGLLREQYQPGADTGSEMLQHEGQECGVLVSGSMELTIDGQVHLLQAGDGYYFPSCLPHRFRNIGTDTAKIISANTPGSF
ncbi:cupin domain-containing protein [Iodobacter ciconiae]|uniref:Cupin domain-containing protein n=1 Tax=Iodobacter ciconiae TaxID=2496266 RepID=A0A3S8ZUK5_9NEIS|nr:cupin domain-containing protein [Iodobacter ciconiae]AZN37139.1 cupin domain-containing protein [Iodobacter ciconiae]